MKAQDTARTPGLTVCACYVGRRKRVGHALGGDRPGVSRPSLCRWVVRWHGEAWRAARFAAPPLRGAYGLRSSRRSWTGTRGCGAGDSARRRTHASYGCSLDRAVSPAQPGKRPERRRPRSDKKQRAEPGHPGKQRQFVDPDQADEIVDPEPERCARCGHDEILLGTAAPRFAVPSRR